MPTKKPSIQAYVPPVVKEAVVLLSQKENRTESSMVGLLVMEALEIRSYGQKILSTLPIVEMKKGKVK